MDSISDMLRRRIALSTATSPESILPMMVRTGSIVDGSNKGGIIKDKDLAAIKISTNLASVHEMRISSR